MISTSLFEIMLKVYLLRKEDNTLAVFALDKIRVP